MAKKRVVDEDVRFNLIINGDKAQKELYDLEKRNRSLTESNKALGAQKAKLIAAGKKESAEYKNVTAEMKRNNAEVKQNKARMKELQSQLGLTALTMRQLRQRAKELRLQLDNMVEGSAQYKKLRAELDAVSNRMSELSLRSKTAKSGISRLADGFNKYAVLAGSFIATGTGMVLSLQRMIDFNGKLSDAQSDVMKTTQMTKKEVNELTRDLGMFKTRTARIELLELGAEAGRLGITGVKNVKDFIEVANEMKVALGDILSDEEIREVGKMVNIYKVGEETGRDFKNSMLALGSSLNAVGASGANTEKFLVDYLKRQAGVASQAKLSAADNVGYAATFDEIGQTVEVSATAMNKIWMDMFKNTDVYAKIAGMSLGEFTKLMNEDANEAMIRMLEGLNGNNEGLAIMVQKLDDIDVGGARGAQALSAIAGQTKLLRERQVLANKALQEGTSLSEEAALKNNNLAGTLDKIKKQMMGWFTSETIVNGMESFMIWFAKFIGASEDADGSVTRFRDKLVFFLKILLILTTAWISYNAAVKLTVLWTNRLAIQQKILNAIQSRGTIIVSTLRSAKLLLAAAYNVLTGNTARATAAMRLFNATMMSNPLGLVLGLLAAAAVALYLFSDRAEKAATQQSMLNDALGEAKKQTAGLSSELEVLHKIASDESEAQQTRIEAIQKLNKIVPDYNKNLDLSTAALKKGKAALDAHIDSLVKLAQQQYLNDQIGIKSRELVELQNSSLEEHTAWYDTLWATIKTGGNRTATTASLIKTAFKQKQEAIDKTTESLEAAKKAYKDFVVANPGTMVTETEFVSNYESTSTGSGTVGSDTTAADNLQKQQDELLKIRRETEDKKLALIQDTFMREMEIEEINFRRKVQDLQTRAEEFKAAAEKEGNTDLASIYMEQYHALYDQIEVEEGLHQQRRNQIFQSGIEDELSSLENKFQREQIARETKQAQELAALGDNEKEKQQLQEQFDAENLTAQKEHLEELIAMGKEILSSGEFEGFNIDLLSETEKQAIVDRLLDLGLSLADINKLLATMKNGGGDEEGGLDLGLGGELDILGFSAQQWVDTFTNLDTVEQKIAAAGMAIQGLANAWAMYSQFVTNAENRSLAKFNKGIEERKRNQKQMLDSGFINQRQYEKAVEQMEKEQDKKKAELEYKQAKRAWQTQLIQSVANTALGVTQALAGSPPPANFILAAIVGALGLAQIAIVAKNKPVKGFESGYYRNTMMVEREQDGKMFNAAYGGQSRSGIVDKPTVFMAGEGGKNFPEMIIDGRTLRQFDPGLKESLYRELGRVRGFESGYYKPNDEGSTRRSDEMDLAILSALNRNSSVMERLERDGLASYMDKDMRNIKKLRDEFERLNLIEAKAKRN